MVAGVSNEHGIQADVIFVIEGTAVNGAYLQDLKANYLIPTLEYFSQGNIEDREYVSENSTTLYGIVVYHAADCLPAPCTSTLGPFSSPHKLLMTLDRLDDRLVGGRGESHANIAEGLATALLCFEDLQVRRDSTTAIQKHCILVCNSPPYQTVVQESYKFAGHAIDSLAGLFQENHISLSILSPRKIPALFKLFDKAGGDLQTSQTKNYAKDSRHLILLRNYNLKERPVSPTIGGTVHPTNTSAAQIPLSPLQSHDSPNTNPVVNPNIPQAQQQQQQNQNFRNQAPANINPLQAVPSPMNVGQMNPGRPPFNPQIAAPPNYHPRGAPARWRTPFITPGTTVQGNNQGSALIAQLTQPPSSHGMNVNIPFNQGGPVMGGNPQQQQQPPQQQQQNQQQSQLSMQLQQQQQQVAQQQQVQQQVQQQQQQQQVQQQQQQQQQQQVRQAQQAQQQATIQALQQAQNQAANQNQSGQPGQLAVSSVGQTMPTQGQQTVNTVSQPPMVVNSVAQQVSHNPGQQQGNVVQQGNVPGQQLAQQQRERPTIWQGILEWLEKGKNPSETQGKQQKQVPCQVSANSKDGEPELKADSWPSKLIMQLMPKQLIGSIGGAYLKNSKSVLFHPTPCEALDSLTKVMSTGFAGCVHFTSPPTAPACDIKVLILLYTLERRAYLGFIPNDQTAFVDRLRKVIQHQKSSQILRQNQMFTQGAPGPANNAIGPGSLPTAPGIPQGGIMMSQTNTMAMGGGQITQNVVAPNNPQQNMANAVPQGQMNMQGAMPQQQVNPQAGGMMGQQRPPFDDLELARQQNLMKIQQLRQTLEAAQQQEAQYKSQLEVNIQQNLEVAQQQEMQYKQQLEAQQAQRGLIPNPGMAGQQPNTQRMMRPVMANNSGLRHLLQQPQPQQYRQQMLGMQQQMVGPRGQMAARPMAPGNPQNQQFDDVPNFDYLG